MMDGLGEILRQKYDPKYQDEAKAEIERKISEIKAEQIKKKKMTKGKSNKIKLEDLS